MSPAEIAQIVASRAPVALAQDESFWTAFAREYDRDDRFVQLNYGYYHPALRAVLDVEFAMAREVNRRGAHFKSLDSASLLEATRQEVAELAGAAPEEIVLTRNASEALNIVIQGLPLRSGDEVVASDQDYTAANQVLDQRATNEGIVVRRVRVPIDPSDDTEVVRAFEEALSDRTKLVLLTHAIHVTGHLLPAEKICAVARARNIPSLVDAAHSFAQIDFSVREFGCDFMAASLHKWLGAPLGTGVLFVRRDRISQLRPLYGDTACPATDVRRLERFGNRPDSLNAGLREAIRWHRALGTAVKRERLLHLHRSWAERLRDHPRFRVLSPRSKERQTAIGLLAMDGMPADSLRDYLYRDHGLFTAVHKVGDTAGVRITPGLPTSVGEIERLLRAVQAAATRL